MTATILDGRKLSKELQQELKDEVTAFSTQYTTTPQLVVVEVEGDPASARYVRSIRKLCDKVGIGFVLEQLPADVTQETLEASIARLSQSPDAHGVLIQMPLPAPLSAERAVMHLAHAKDVDGIHPINAGLLAQGRPAFVPNTPAGGMLLLNRYDIALEGKRAAVIGRSAIVGRPMAFLLLQAHATVTICHSRTKNLPEVLQACDIVVVATGQPGLVHGDMLRPGAVVVDFGINVLDDGSMVGDVDFSSAVETASAITPVPGGTGPVTNVMLLRNVITAAKRQMSGNV
jgi:methylenetetrahydrofolate dehydrogenase (NADP+)/methenyltetrahydrofolate cyclohydrolase